MKKITILLVIIFTFLFSTTSWGEWIYVTKTLSGSNVYYDKVSVRKSGKYILFWYLQNSKPTKFGDLSATKHTKLDCSLFRFKYLRFRTFNKSMGEGNMTSDYTPKDEWWYPPPDSIVEYVYNKICEEHQ